jgi:hypothetical protein
MEHYEDTILGRQLRLTDTILQSLECISPYAILAGGAPRDWYFGNEAKDLDFYLYSSAITTKALSKQLSNALGIDIARISFQNKWEESLYTTMRRLSKIVNISGYDFPVQVMILKEPNDEFKVVEDMSTSICKVWYKDSKINLTKDFKLTVASGKMFLNEGYSWTDPHPKKMMERFRDKYCVSTRQSAEDTIIMKTLKEI